MMISINEAHSVFIQVQDGESSKTKLCQAETFKENMLRYINTSSTDSLNIVRQIFEHKKYDMKNIDAYIQARDEKSLNELKSQIQELKP